MFKFFKKRREAEKQRQFELDHWVALRVNTAHDERAIDLERVERENSILQPMVDHVRVDGGVYLHRPIVLVDFKPAWRSDELNLSHLRVGSVINLQPGESIHHQPTRVYQTEAWARFNYLTEAGEIKQLDIVGFENIFDALSVGVG